MVMISPAQDFQIPMHNPTDVKALAIKPTAVKPMAAHDALAALNPVVERPAIKYKVERIPTGYKDIIDINGQPLFFNPGTKRYYNPATRSFYSNITKAFEKAKPASFGVGLLDPIVVKAPAQLPAIQAIEAPIEPPIDNEDNKKVYMGRTWQKICDVFNKALKKLAGSLCLVFAAALAVATACGGYATFALLIQQGNPVGVIVGFLTLYFGVATYKYTKIALEKLNRENKPLDCLKG